jgi:hypothetical protein
MKTTTILLVAILFALMMVQTSVAQSLVVMNEIQSRGVPGNLDWIEIYNSSSAPFDISGYRIYDIGGQGGTKPKKPFPAGTVIPAKGFYVIITDTASFPGDLSGFGLSSSGEKVWLEDTTTHTIIDTVTYAATANATQTYGRGPDGGAWTVLNTITRGTSNGSVVMNEIFARGVPGNLDWIEIYNGVSSSVNISGYRIYDIGGQGGTRPKKPFPAGTILPANGFYVIITDTADFPGDLSGFGLSSSGEKVWLEDTTTHTIIDTVTYAATANATQSYARIPDGGTWQIANTITRGLPNIATAVKDPLVLVHDYALGQNYPNPFNPVTTIGFRIPTRSFVTLQVFDILGREVASLVGESLESGLYTVQLDGSRLSSGVYYYQLVVGDFTRTKALTLLK